MSAFQRANPGLVIGCRVKDAEGFSATVMYIGPVASATNQDEIYCGLEWDDVSRGKHDGSGELKTRRGGRRGCFKVQLGRVPVCVCGNCPTVGSGAK